VYGSAARKSAARKNKKPNDIDCIRNFLVHQYGNIDNEIAFEYIITCLEDFERIFKEIKK